jgi:predicted SprT family Zn-dependent metalloprotease
MQRIEPTAQTYAELRQVYDLFNTRLFDDSLPPCLLTLQREKRTYGYFSSARFGSHDGTVTDEIALNPEYFAVVPLLEVLQTVAHEMVHLWQAHLGTPGRGRYHNAEWADKMEAIGLMPSSTGRPGGRRVGDRVADYMIAGGRFEEVVNHLVRDQKFSLSWYDRCVPHKPLYETTQAHEASALPESALAVPATQGLAVVQSSPTPAANRSNRVKYTCPGCNLNAWGKPAIRLGCMACALELVAEESGTQDADHFARALPRPRRPVLTP